MAGQSWDFILYSIVSFVTYSEGLQLFMDITPDSDYCGRLLCSFDKRSTDNNKLIIIGLAVYNQAQPNNSIKLASLSVFGPDICIRESEINDVNATGNISLSQAELTLDLRNQSYCLTGSFLCELEFVNASSQPDVIRRYISPWNSGNCHNTEKESDTFKMKEQIAEFEKENLQLQTLVVELGNFTVKLGKESFELQTQNDELEKQVADLKRENVQLEKQFVELENDTVELQKQVVEHEIENVRLQKQVTEHKNGNLELVEQVVEFQRETVTLQKQIVELEIENVKFEKHIVDINNNTVTLEKTIAEFSKEILGLKKEVEERTQDNMTLKCEAFMLQEIVNKSIIQEPCIKGANHKYPRENVLLWDKVPALCDRDTDGGAWIVIQRRTKGDVDFYRGWADYKNGFGTPDTDFWIGNDNIHNLTLQGYTELRIDMEYNGALLYAHYSHFDITDETSNYRLSVSGYSGTAKDGLGDGYSGMEFSTHDKSHSGGINCASQVRGAWWYRRRGCYTSNLNGLWGATNNSGLAWYWANMYFSSYEMKIRHV